MNGAPPKAPPGANLHVALALALGASPQETDKQLIERVYRMRRAAVEAVSRDGLFGLLDEGESS